MHIAARSDDLVLRVNLRTVVVHGGHGGDHDRFATFGLPGQVFDLGQAREWLGGENRIARTGSGAAVDWTDGRPQFRVDKEVAAAAFRRVVRLDGQNIFAFDEIAAWRRQIELDKAVLLDRRAGAGAKARFLG